MDVVATLFRLVKNHPMPELAKLEFIKAIGFCSLRVGEGVGSALQMSGLLAKLCLAQERTKGL